MPPAPEVVFVVALAHDRVIGAQGRLPWRLPEDLRRFKRLTVGHPVVMGRATFDSIGAPLPGRTSIVATRQRALEVPAGVLVAGSPEAALERAARLDAQVCVIGGAQVFAQLLPRARVVEATFVYERFAGDARFPPLGPGWRVAGREDLLSATGLRASFVRLERGAGPARPPAAMGEEWDRGFAALLRDLQVEEPGAASQR